MKSLGKNQKWIVIIVFVVIAIGLLILSVYNSFNNNDFWNVSISSILSLFIALYISFYMTQLISERRERNNHIEKLLIDICNIVNSDEIFDTGDDAKKNKAKILQRKMANKIDILKGYNLEGKSGDEIKLLDEHFKGVRDLFGNHINESDFKQRNDVDIMNYISKIEDCCDRIIHEMYK